MDRSLSRRRCTLAGLVAPIAGAVLSSVAVISAAASTPPSDPATSATGDTPTSVAIDDFPVTVEHKFGTTTIESEPQRVVSVGWNDQDVVLALGVVPVGYRGWFDEYPTFPWVVDAVESGGGGTMQELDGEIDLEAVAALEPDLIVDVYDTVDQAMYDRLTQIAPTVVQSDEFADEETPWQDQTRLIGQALGRSALADQLVTDLEQAFEDVAGEHPDFADQILVANFYPDLGTGEQWLLGAGDPRRQLFDRLGFGAQEQTGATSAEQIELLDRDVLVVNGVTRADWLDALPAAAALDVIADDRAVFIADDSPVSGALAYGSALSLAYALEELTPQLIAAADGDPATAVTDL